MLSRTGSTLVSTSGSSFFRTFLRLCVVVLSAVAAAPSHAQDQRVPAEYVTNLKKGIELHVDQKYEEALTYLSRAYVKFPDPEVAAHLGEVMWATGDTEGAKTIWRAALMKAPKHKILVATLERLGVSDLQVPVTGVPK